MRVTNVCCDLCGKEVAAVSPVSVPIEFESNGVLPLTLTLDVVPSGSVREPDGTVLYDANGVNPTQSSLDVCTECLDACLVQYISSNPGLLNAIRHLLKEVRRAEKSTKKLNQLSLFTEEYLEDLNAPASSGSNPREYDEPEVAERDPEATG